MTKGFRLVQAFVVGIVITGVAGCGGHAVEPYTMPADTADPAFPPPVESSPSGPPPGPVMYAFADFPSCSEMQQKSVGLPPPLEPHRSAGQDRFSQECTFTNSNNDGLYISFRVELYENAKDRYGYRSGGERAKTSFDEIPWPDEEEESELGFGEQAHWSESTYGEPELCRLEVLDANATMTLSYNPLGEKFDRDRDMCRQGARTVARQLHAAMQLQ